MSGRAEEPKRTNRIADDPMSRSSQKRLKDRVTRLASPPKLVSSPDTPLRLVRPSAPTTIRSSDFYQKLNCTPPPDGRTKGRADEPKRTNRIADDPMSKSSQKRLKDRVTRLASPPKLVSSPDTPLRLVRPSAPTTIRSSDFYQSRTCIQPPTGHAVQLGGGHDGVGRNSVSLPPNSKKQSR